MLSAHAARGAIGGFRFETLDNCIKFPIRMAITNDGRTTRISYVAIPNNEPHVDRVDPATGVRPSSNSPDRCGALRKAIDRS